MPLGERRVIHRARAGRLAGMAVVAVLGTTALQFPRELARAGATPARTPWEGRLVTPERAQRAAVAARPLHSRHLKASQERALQLRSAPASLHVLVVGCDFSDSLMVGRDLDLFPGWPTPRRHGHYLGPLLAFENRAVFEFDRHDSTYFDVQMQRVRDYFLSVSRGQFTLTWEVGPSIVNLPRAMGYYGQDDTSSVRVVEMARDVVAAIDPDVDFAAYDTLVLIHAGAGQETDILRDSSDQIYSNYLDVRDFTTAHAQGTLPEPRLSTADGVDVGHVLILPESESQDPIPGISDGFFGTLGVYCFEFGLRLGMLNLADFTPRGFPDSQGAGQFDLMSYGLFSGLGLVPAQPSAINRALMGWVRPVTIAPSVGETLSVAVGAIASSQSDTLLLRVPIDSRQYWLAEYRLQDPDGNLRFSFPGDLNGNGFPDYYDADSDSSTGFPTTPFTPGRDTWENTVDAEWDFDMSEWLDGARYRRGRGSGLYVWHIDERVIEDAIRSGRNSINADPAHKGVDLEEADGIQDLDDPQPSVYFLGWDGDAFRGERVDRFDPASNPSTDTADREPTGLSLHAIGRAAVDSLKSPAGELIGFAYASALPLRVSRAAADQPLARERARLRLDRRGPLHDVRVADLLPGDGSAMQIVAAGDSGVVYALTADLAEWVDGDADATTSGVLATAAGLSAPPQWLGPPAVGDLDGDGQLEVVLAGADGLYAFRGGSGAEVRDGDANPATVGVLVPLPGATLVGSPLLHPLAVPAETAPPDAQVAIAQLARIGGQTRLLRIAADGAGGFTVESSSDFEGTPIGPPTLVLGATGTPLAFAFRGAAGDGLAFTPVGTSDPWAVLDGARASSLPLLSYRFAPGHQGGAVAWVDSAGSARVGLAPPALGGQRGSEGAGTGPGPWSALMGAPARAGGAPVLAFATSGALVLLDRNLRARTGSPYLPDYRGAQVAGGDVQATPLAVDLDGDGVVELVWHDPVGRLHAVTLAGKALAGWPLAGPSEPSGSPAVADLDGDGLLELVAMGGFDTLEGNRPSERAVDVRRTGELRVYDLTASASSFAPWNQGRGDAWNTGAQRSDDSQSAPAATGAAFVPESLVVYPSPAVGGTARVRAELTRQGLVEGWMYNLEGQEVRRLPSVLVDAGASYDEAVSIDGLAGGLYICRLRLDGEAIFRTFAVAR